MADTNTYDSFQKVEKWTTREKFNALDLSTIETGTEYNLAGAIEETDLASDLQTKINGKLTAPTTPTADSVVTMAANGTVGTKALNEIGGGKLYLHSMNFTNSNGYVNVIYYNTNSTPISIANNNIPSGYCYVGMMDGPQRGAVAVYIIKNDNSTYSASINGCVSSAASEIGMAFYNELINITDSNFTDTVTEV